MPIPALDPNLVLPPHLGNPVQFLDLSPYRCSTLELCQRFCTSASRFAILQGFLQFRDLLHNVGFVDGFQWVSGSFVEDIETKESRDPQDVDVVTFYQGLDVVQQAAMAMANPILSNHQQIKATYHVDHYPVDIAYTPFFTVESTRYWTSLFSHRRDRIWKGMLRVELNTPMHDADAGAFIQQWSAANP